MTMDEHPKPKKELKRRRRANVEGGRHHQHMVRVTPEEEARLLQRAMAQGVTVPRLLIESTLHGHPETPTERREAMRELFALRRQLAGIANNVNQIARAANTDRRAPVGTAAALERVREVADKIEAAIDALGRR